MRLIYLQASTWKQSILTRQSKINQRPCPQDALQIVDRWPKCWTRRWKGCHAWRCLWRPRAFPMLCSYLPSRRFIQKKFLRIICKSRQQLHPKWWPSKASLDISLSPKRYYLRPLISIPVWVRWNPKLQAYPWLCWVKLAFFDEVKSCILCRVNQVNLPKAVFDHQKR